MRKVYFFIILFSGFIIPLMTNYIRQDWIADRIKENETAQMRFALKRLNKGGLFLRRLNPDFSRWPTLNPYYAQVTRDFNNRKIDIDIASTAAPHLYPMTDWAIITDIYFDELRGLVVEMQNNDYVISYGHLKRCNRTIGDFITKDQCVGEIGNSGYCLTRSSKGWRRVRAGEDKGKHVDIEILKLQTDGSWKHVNMFDEGYRNEKHYDCIVIK